MMKVNHTVRVPKQSKTVFTSDMLVFLVRCRSNTHRDYYPDSHTRERLMMECCERVRHAEEDILFFIDCFKAFKGSYLPIAEAQSSTRFLRENKEGFDDALGWAEAVELDRLWKQMESRHRKR